MQSAYDPDKRKLINALSHGSIFFNALILNGWNSHRHSLHF